MAEYERDFKGIWIPREIWLDTRMTAVEKGILMEIDSLDRGEGCRAGNAHLAEFCQCSERKVTEAISKLIKLGYIRVISFDGRRRFLGSCIAKNVIPHSRNCEADKQNLRESNIKRNTMRNTLGDKPRKSEREETFTKPDIDELRAYIDDKGYQVDAEEFMGFYDSNGWKVGKNPMKSWKGALLTWHKRRMGSAPKKAMPEEPRPRYERF